MNRYQTLKQLGDGTYGSVILATVHETGEKVAIKKMKKKYYSWDECLNLREVKSLRKLNHANIVKLKEVIRENDQLYFVFEYMKENLYEMIKSRDKLFPESAVRNVIYQVLQGLAFMHKHGYFHRDLKPENLLCQGPDCIKLADFGLARETRSRPPYTDYVSTRWYRAPEVLLRSTNYNSPIDIWAVGCIMAEVYTLRPLFPGSSEVDQLFKLCSIMGTPTKQEWPEGHKLSAAMNFRWPQLVKTPLKQIIPSAGSDGLAVMQDMMMWAPEKRPSCQQCLRHSFFKVGGNLGTKLPTPQQNRPAVQQPPQQQPSYTKPQQKSIYGDTDNNRALPQISQQPKKPAQENKDPFSMQSARKSGRKRWNVGGGGSGFQDSMDDWLDELGSSHTFSTTKVKSPTKHQPAQNPPWKPAPVTKKKSIIPDFDDDDDDFFSSTFGRKKPGALPKLASGNKDRINSGRSSASSAKQLYMSKSRYIPGGKPMSGKKESPNPWNKGANYGMNPNRAQNNPLGPSSFNSNTTTGYVPNFGGSAATNKTNYRAGGWKRAEPAPLALNKHSNTNQYQPVGGTRTDWAAKYLK